MVDTRKASAESGEFTRATHGDLCDHSAMALTVYQYPACSTCRKALKWLEQAGIAYAVVHIVENPPSVDVLKRALAHSGKPIRALFNTSGESYRNGGFKDRLPTLSDEEAFACLAADGKLIKRPLVVSETTGLIGFDEALWSQTLRA